MAKRKRSRKSSTTRKVSRPKASRKRKPGSARKTRKAAGYGSNPPKHRRRRSSRGYRRNPSLGGLLPSKGMIFDAVYVTGGFIGTKLAANFVLPMIGVNQPIVRIGVKTVLAAGLGWVGKRFLGNSAGQYLLIGGLVEAVNDAVQTYVTPYVPALAVSSYPELSYNGGDYMGVYPGMSAYPDLSGMVSDDTMESV